MILFYNTLTRKKEEFIPDGKTVKMYTCGPTVYTNAHIGNFRAYLFMDTIRRILLYNDHNLKTVLNITDVGHLTDDQDSGEDKIEKEAKKLNMSPEQIARKYMGLFFEDYKKLNILDVEKKVKATDNIKDMIKFVEGLISKNFAYVANGDVYFDVQAYEKEYSYNVLSGSDNLTRMAGARVDVDTKKKNSRDFALWIKAPKNHIMKWKSPWGDGYPGWHIECSTMGKKHLGDVFDIHTGGVDHAAMHHENEIAQSRALTGCIHARHWMHCEFLMVDGGKMSKSLGNAYTISDLEDRGFAALDFRYFILNASFRKAQNFTFKALEGAKLSRRNLMDYALKRSEEKKVKKDLSVYKKRFDKCINDDLGIPEGLAVVWEMLKKEKGQGVFNMLLEFDRVLGLDLEREVARQKRKSTKIPSRIKDLAEQRWQAKVEKRFDESDKLRENLLKKGYLIKDTADKYVIIKVNK